MKPVSQWIRTHPRLTAWIVLGLGMNAMVIFEARSVGLLLGQWAALVVATSLVSGLCVWIIGWEDDAEDAEAEAEVAPVPAPATAAEASAMPGSQPPAPASKK